MATWGTYTGHKGGKRPVEVTAFPMSVADIKGSEEEEQFIFLYHITDFKAILTPWIIAGTILSILQDSVLI